MNQDNDASRTVNTPIAGIDFGTVRVGIALADEKVGIASPHMTYTRQNSEQDTAFFRKFAKDEAIGRFVVGLPVHLDGRESQKSVEARDFGRWLEEVTGVPVVFFDERFTTTQADELLAFAGMTKKKKKARRDQLAAQIMLAAYLESDRCGQDDPGAIDG